MTFDQTKSKIIIDKIKFSQDIDIYQDLILVVKLLDNLNKVAFYQVDINV